MRQELANQRRDASIARIAGRQHGVLSLTQLSDCGVDPSGVKRRVAAGRLHRIHRGVYAVGHAALSDEGRWMAAVLACGESAVLSHRSAARLWGILPASGRGRSGPARGCVDVTVPGNGGRARRQGIRVHRSITLSPAHCTIRTGIPVTTPSSHAGGSSPCSLQCQSSPRRSARPSSSSSQLATGPTGTARAQNSRPLPQPLVRRHRLPRPEVNVRIDRYEVDFLWRDQSPRGGGRRLGIAPDAIRIREGPGAGRAPEGARIRGGAVHMATD